MRTRDTIKQQWREKNGPQKAWWTQALTWVVLILWAPLFVGSWIWVSTMAWGTTTNSVWTAPVQFWFATVVTVWVAFGTGWWLLRRFGWAH